MRVPRANFRRIRKLFLSSQAHAFDRDRPAPAAALSFIGSFRWRKASRGAAAQVGRFLAFEDAVDISGRTAVWVDWIRPVRNQAATDSVKAERVDRGQSVSCRKRDDQFAVKDRETSRRAPKGA